MLNKLRSKKGAKGFTLIELMIVVAIIGILAAIAIPNFLRFQAKSRTSEGKTNLKAIHIAQGSYYGEHNNYSDFATIGWTPVGRTLIYGYTLQAANPAAANAGTATGVILISGGNLEYLSSNGIGGTISWAVPAPYNATITSGTPGIFAVSGVDNQAFIAGAAGMVGPRSLVADCWIITDTNVLINTQSGI